MKKIQAKIFLTAILLLGTAALLNCLVNWRMTSMLQFVCFLAIALGGSMLKVVLPNLMGSLSINYIFVLIGVAELSLSECTLITCASAVAQSFFKARHRPKPIQIAFNIANVAFAVSVSYRVYHSSYLEAQAIGIPLLLVVTAITYFLINTFPVASIIALTESKSFRVTWKECYLWSFPFYLAGAAIAYVFHLMAAHFGWQIAILTLPAGYAVYKTYQLYLGRLQDEKVHAQKIASLHLRTIEALALAIDAKDHTTHDHLQRVQTYAIGIGKQLGLSSDEIEALRAAALLHDIGKLAVPEHIISKPGRLTPEEFEKMKIHPDVGAEILERVKFPYPVVPIVRSHHEKWDGSGYPHGLQGAQIPIGARILAVVDCLDALASDRQYRKAIPMEEALAVVVSEAGRSFDPEVVAVLQTHYEALESQARQQPAAKRALPDNLKVERGESPAVGFEETKQSIGSERDKLGFLISIAAAREEVQTLFELSNDLGNSLTLTEMLSMVEVRLKRMIPHHAISVTTIRDGRLVPEYVCGTDHQLFSSVEIPLGQGLSGWVAQNSTPIINGNPAVEPGYLADPTKITNLRSALAIPLANGDVTMGVLTLYHAEKNAFSKDHLRILLALGQRLAMAITKAQELFQARESATIDFLTSLPNSRSLFLHLHSELERCRRQKSRLTVLVCDLDGFKQINDQFGHLEGNRVLQSVALELQSCCREYDYVARMGGDEFVILLPNISENDLNDKIDSLRTAIYALGTRRGLPMLSLSIGEASHPDTLADADGILAEADRKMYADKRDRKLKLAPGTPQRRTKFAVEDMRQPQETLLIQ